MELNLLDSSGQACAKVEAPDTIFGREYNEPLIHQVVVAFQANARSANRAQKDRSEVRHSTKKPWRQKGTGRARAGMTSSPLWRGGGKIFPNSPEENFSHKVNRKMYRAGVCSILSQLAREDRVAVVEGLAIDAPKTKLLADKIKAMGWARTVRRCWSSSTRSMKTFYWPRVICPTSWWWSRVMLTRSRWCTSRRC